MKTPMTFLIESENSKETSIEKLLLIYPNLQKYRMSWRSSDTRFSGFVNFIEQHGTHSNLSLSEWELQLKRHLEYLPNQHLLFMLTKNNVNQEEKKEFYANWLPPEISKKFVELEKKWEMDNSLMSTLNEICTNKALGSALHFRNIPLTKAFMYETIRDFVSIHKIPDSNKESS